MQGSIATVGVTCGQPNCRCAHGDKHTSHILTKKVRGKTKSVYVPVDMLQEATSWVEEHRRLKKRVKEISDLNEQILKIYVRTKRAREKNQDAARS